MKSCLSLIALFFITTTTLIAQDLPSSCENPVPVFSDAIKGKITSQVKTAYNYFMNSLDPSVGNTYTQRTANFNAEVANTFQAFMTARRNEYRNSICTYYKTTKANPGNNKGNDITVQNGFYLMIETLERTTNGDWKGGPSYNSSVYPSSMSWVTGGHKTSNTFAKIKAKYKEDFIQNMILNEMDLVRKELNNSGIPVDLPPFFNN